ncbi:MAG: type II toxin-antitoxin system VapC family toxin [Candidatus Eremiobacteraeota bacterium]|nr:type II toxin-antitoxin system VapC family toxin [Candidatus Eremiobacteraeota bacterium]
MRIVIDASAAFVMLATPARVAQPFADATDVLAPELIVAEVLNARWKVARAGAIAPSLDAVLGLFDRIHLARTVPYAADAAALAQHLDHPVCDCLYAVLAKRENARFATADPRFAAKLINESVDVVVL